MNKTYVRQILIFVAALVLLNLVFHLHISIIGSVLLTIALNFAFNYFAK